VNFRKRIKQLSFEQMLHLTFVLIRRPLLIRPTLRATKQTMKICDSLYGKAHHKNGKANAFRHAFWNIEICRRSYSVTNNVDKSVNWAKKITDLHEKMAPNEKLETAMDIHNNEIGRILFLSFFDQNESKIIDFIKKRAKYAQKMTKIQDIEKCENELVYISE